MIITTRLEVNAYQQIASPYPINFNDEIQLMGTWLKEEKHTLIKSFIREVRDRPVTIIGIVSEF